MDVTQALTRLGGIATRKELFQAQVLRRDLEGAVSAGRIVRPTRGRYALPTDVKAVDAARSNTAVAILVTAAAHWQWKRMWEPRKVQLAVPVGRKLTTRARSEFDLRWRNLPAGDVVGGWVTSRIRTVVDCCVLLPFDQALAITDSALRSGTVERTALLARVPALDPQLRPRVLRVVECADAFAANPFESALRAIALDVPRLTVTPQVRIDDADGWVGRVDLADHRLRIVIEAESFEFHGEKEVLDKDCARYSRLVADGWLVLRFSWTQVMTKPDWVRTLIARTVATRSRCAARPECT